MAGCISRSSERWVRLKVDESFGWKKQVRQGCERGRPLLDFCREIMGFEHFEPARGRAVPLVNAGRGSV
jgi:hypothetical protein